MHRHAYLGVVNVDGKATARYPKNRGVVEKFRKLLGVQGGAGDEQLEVRPEPGNILDQTEEYVCV